MHAGGRTHVASRLPPGRMRVTRAAVAAALAVVAATAAVAFWGNRDLPVFLKARPAARVVGAPVPPVEERLFGPPLRRIRLDDQTPEFEPEAYAMYYNANATDDDLSSEDYLSAGRPAHRVFQRLRVVLSYEPGSGYSGEAAAKFGGLCNQLYIHVGMLALALQSGSEVVLPNATHRGGRQFQDNYDAGEIQPVRAPLDTLLDVDHLTAWGAASGAVFHRSQPELGTNSVAVDVDGPSICCLHPLEHLIDAVRAAVLGAVEAHLRGNPGQSLPAVRLTLRPPQLLFALNTLGPVSQLVEDIARNLRPAPRIQTLADAVTAKLTAAGAYNGVHLRMEQDAHFWELYNNSTEVYWNAYLAAMEGVGFNGSTPLYVASGLLTYMNESEWEAAVSPILDRGLCSGMVTKEFILTAAQTEGLMSEALALIDLLVLVGAARFTGFGASTMSWVVQEYRCLAGSPASTSSYPEPSRGILIYLWDNAALLSDHAATCPESA